ncbi:hypothetical protein [Burkholderia singularis]|uniref:hypothetical protein n=1 Tax=Burkholderia singularis TaxID=1503053 RepID=UPI000AC9654C|nr:hypothetical protein [Burkholderia singularis]
MQLDIRSRTLAYLSGLACALSIFVNQPASAFERTAGISARATETQAHQTWRARLVHTPPTPAAGCFRVSYPNLTWKQVACDTTAARAISLLRKSSLAARFRTAIADTDNSNGYVLAANGLINTTLSQFTFVIGVTSITDGLIPMSDLYSLRILSDGDSTTTACNGVADCKVHQEFVYNVITDQAMLYMVSWLLNYTAGGQACPTGWFSDGATDCMKVSDIQSVPVVSAPQLGKLTMLGGVTPSGNITVSISIDAPGGAQTYSVTAPDDLKLATVWRKSSFNVYGQDSGPSGGAEFNPGSFLVTTVQVIDGTSTAPACLQQPIGSFTWTGNNLTLQGCKAFSFNGLPAIQFVESN